MKLEEEELEIPEYWAFISYRHADNQEQDRSWASWLHQEIERYEVPAELVGKKNSRGDAIPERIYPVFRDQDSLSADADLGGAIEAALGRSKFLVVLCSPRAVESRYVEQEIRYFKELGRADRIVAAIVAGEPGGGDDDCFPSTLFGDGGEVEPIAADFRLADGSEGYTSAEVYRKELLQTCSKQEAETLAGGYETRLQLMKLKVIAGILGVPLETIRDRDKAYQLAKARARAKALTRWLSLVVILALLTAVAGGLAWRQREIARAEAAATLVALSEAQFERGADLVDKGDPAAGAAVLARSLRLDPENSAAAARLYSLLAHRTHLLPGAPPVATPGDVVSTEFSPGGAEFILRSVKRGPVICDSETAEVLRGPIEVDGGIIGVTWVSDRELLVAFSRYTEDAVAGFPAVIQRWDAQTLASAGEEIQTGWRDNNLKLRFDSDSDTACLWSRSANRARFWNIGTGEELWEGIETEGRMSGVWMLPGWVFVTENRNQLSLYDWETGGQVAKDSPLADRGQWHDFTAADGAVIGLMFGKNSDGKRVWGRVDLKTGGQMGSFVDPDYMLTSARFDSTGLLATCRGRDQRAYRLSIAGFGRQLCEPVPHRGTSMPAAAPDNRRLLTSPERDQIQVWECPSSMVNGLAFLKTRGVQSMSLAESAEVLAVHSGESDTRVYNSRTGEALGESIDAARGQNVTGITLSPGGGMVAVQTLKHGVVVGESGGDPDSVWRAHESKAVDGCEFSSDESLLLVAYDWSRVALWDTRERARLAESGALGKVLAFGFLGDGERFWVAREKTIEVWSIAGRSQVREFSSIPDIAWNTAAARVPGSLRVATAARGDGVRFWDLETGKEEGTPIPLSDSVTGLDFSSGGRFLLVTFRTELRVFDTRTGEEASPTIRVQQLRTAAVSGDGKRVMTNGNSRVRLWDVETGRPISDELPSHPPAVLSADDEAIIRSEYYVAIRTRMPPAGPPPAWLPDLAEAVFLSRLDEEGRLEQGSGKDWLEIRPKLLALGGDGRWERFARWFAADPWTRPVVPGAEIRTEDYLLEQMMPEFEAIREAVDEESE